ncbi:MAG: hypothetical protein ACYC4Q_03365 [Victivallaceae bacterium]
MTLRKLFLCIIFPSLSIIILAGCVDINYVGQQYPQKDPDAEVIFYNSTADVPKNTYRIIGRANIEAPGDYNPAEIKLKILDKARDCGADAVEVVEFKREKTGEQNISKSPEYDNTVGFWSGNGLRSDGSPIYVDSFDKAVPLKHASQNIFVLKIKILFLITSERFQKFQEQASAERQKDREKERTDRAIESKKAIDQRELEMLNVTSGLQADI